MQDYQLLKYRRYYKERHGAHDFPIIDAPPTNQDAEYMYSALALYREDRSILRRSKKEFDSLMPGYRVFKTEGFIVAGADILPYPDHEACEVVVFTIHEQWRSNKLKKHILNVVRAMARDNYKYMFACGEKSRSNKMFLHYGFRQVSKEDVPPEKWIGYPKWRDPWVVRMELGPKDHRN